MIWRPSPPRPPRPAASPALDNAGAARLYIDFPVSRRPGRGFGALRNPAARCRVEIIAIRVSFFSPAMLLPFAQQKPSVSGGSVFRLTRVRPLRRTHALRAPAQAMMVVPCRCAARRALRSHFTTPQHSTSRIMRNLFPVKGTSCITVRGQALYKDGPARTRKGQAAWRFAAAAGRPATIRVRSP